MTLHASLINLFSVIKEGYCMCETDVLNACYMVRVLQE